MRFGEIRARVELAGRRMWLKGVAALAILLCATNANAHPNHISMAEARWNAKTQKLEVQLKLHPNDLERALRQRFKRRIVLETTPDVDRLIQRYLAEVFVVKQADGRSSRLKWIGKEVSVKAGWLYFEVPMTNGPDGATFTNRMFFELLADQVNTINLKVGSRRKSLSLTPDQPAKKVQLSLADESP